MSREQQGMFTVKEAADFMRLSRETITRWIKSRDLPAMRTGPKGGRLLIARRDLEELAIRKRAT